MAVILLLRTFPFQPTTYCRPPLSLPFTSPDPLVSYSCTPATPHIALYYLFYSRPLPLLVFKHQHLNTPFSLPPLILNLQKHALTISTGLVFAFYHLSQRHFCTLLLTSPFISDFSNNPIHGRLNIPVTVTFVLCSKSYTFQHSYLWPRLSCKIYLLTIYRGK